MEALHGAVAGGDVAAGPLDYIGVDIGAVHLYGGRQVQDYRALRCRLDDLHNRFADLEGELGLSSGEAFGGGLVTDLGSRQRLLKASTPSGGIDGNIHNPAFVQPE